jgi:methylisocitrate lyase
LWFHWGVRTDDPASPPDSEDPWAERRRTFRDLHGSGCFVMPNPWDVGSARLLAALGFPALATSSAGVAWSLGRADNHLALYEALSRIGSIAAAVDVPVNADFEGGFAIAPEGVATNVTRAVTGTGISGLSIEDSTGDPGQPLFDRALCVERVRAAREAIDASGARVVLTARTEGFVVGRPDLDETVRRLAAFAAAGADCLFAPGIRTREEITAVVAAVRPKPVNVVVGGDFATVAELAALGVRRISVGGALARAAWTSVLGAAREIAGPGTFTALGRIVPSAELNEAFSKE